MCPVCFVKDHTGLYRPLIPGSVPAEVPAGSTRSRAGGGALGAFALVFVEELFAQPDGLGGDLDQLVVVDEFERLFQIAPLAPKISPLL